MSADTISRRVDRGVAWVGLATSFVAVFDLAALALLLHIWVSEEEFGLVSVVATMFGALQLIGEGGLPAAVIQREDADEDRLSTVYWFGLGLGALGYATIWLVAPLIADTYDRPILAPLFRVFGLILVLRPLYTTQQAVLRRSLRFKELAVVRIVANTLEFGVKVGTAAGGLGLWAFALGALARELTYAIGVPLQLGWRPRFVFRARSIAADLRFGIRANGGELLFQIYSNLDYQVVAYAFGPAALGIYRAAYELVLEPVRFLSGIVTVVAFPAFSRMRADRAELIEQLIAFVRQNLMVVLPLVGVILIAAEDALTVFLGAKYAVAADAARILAIVGILRALSHLGPPLLDGLGRPDLTLRYQAIAAFVLSSSFVACGRFGSSIDDMALAWVVGYPIAFVALGVLVLDQLALPVGAFFKRIWRLGALVGIACAVGFAAHLAAEGLGPAVRLGIATASVLAVGGVLLARFEGLSPLAISRRLRG